MISNTNIVIMALAPLLMYRVYKRVQRLTVRQQSRTWRHWCAVTLFPLLLVGLAVAVIHIPLALAAIAGGVVVGAILGVVALRRTGFERVGSDYFYTPYAPIGMVVSMLFIARMAYRIFEMVTLGVQQTPNLGSSPLTLSILGIMAGYYLAYGAGLLRWRSAERALEQKA
ncbi:hypothetical protein [Massilia sp. TWP1-3-3]|uniref:hypothetical protein n=1 Tax=Massilia sp. TWP1-3-3 TaxID=2804573 RepID=UPI003CE75B92